MYAIIGATGNTGRVIVEELLSHGQKVRAIARNADHLKALSAKGAEAFVGSVDDDEAMTRAFTGATAVYAMIPPNYAAPGGFRAYQNEAANVIATAIERTGVKYVVVLSSIGAEHAEHTGPVKGLHDFEQRLSKLSGVNVLFLRPTFFMENTLANIGLIKQMGINGGAVKADLPIAMIAARDVGMYAAKRLLALDFSGKTVQDLLGPREITWTEATRIIGDAIGKPELRYVQFPYDDAVNGMVSMGLPRQIAELFIELSRAANDGLIVPSKPRSPESTTPTPFEQFVEEEFAPAIMRP
ncbi:MAG TPA: NAD(P)H-binding protein [bacterium]|jgi:uncharacterized protein YbjT (DUF2867 family)